jgi:hypothetical protein
MGLGDLVHKVANPIAKSIDGVLGTDIEHCGGCAARRAALNNFSDHFWSKGEKTTMEEFIVEVAVTAADGKEAANKIPDAAGRVMAVRIKPKAQFTAQKPAQPIVAPR